MRYLLVPSETMGRGDDNLGRILLEKFFTTLAESGKVPEKIFFYNTGVKLTLLQSPIAPYLRVLNQRGVEINACGTCLDYFKIKPEPFIRPGSMAGFVDALTSLEETYSL